MIDLKGHQALVTGSTMGVGKAIADSLADAGADILLHGLSANSMALDAVSGICKRGRSCHLLTSDLSGKGPESARKLFEDSVRLYPDMDILISNAGTYSEPDFLEVTYEQFDRTMQLNVYSHFFLAQFFARYWVSRGIAGRIVLTGSINGILSEPTHSAYDTSKGAIGAMVRSLCVSLAPRGIRVNGIAPGLVRTPLTSPALNQPGVTEWMQLHTPNRQVPTADVCGPAVAFLVSDLASHIHGQMLLIDGGMSIWQQPDPPK